MLQLIYKIGGDINPLKKSLDGVKDEAKKAGNEAGKELGKEMGAQAKGVLMSFIGAGAIVSLIRGQLEMTDKIGKEQVRTGLGAKEVQVLMRASEMSGMSIDELRESGKINPAAFRGLIEPIEKQGGFLTEEQVQRGIASAQDINAVKRGGQTAAVGAISGAAGAFRAPFDVAKSIEELLPTERNRKRFGSRAPLFRDIDALVGGQRMITGEQPGNNPNAMMNSARDLSTAKETQEMSQKLSIIAQLLSEKL